MRVYSGVVENSTFELEDGTYFEVVELNGSKYRWEKIGDLIVFTTDFIACPRIAYSNYGDQFIFDLYRKGITEFVSNYYEDAYKEVLEEPYCGLKESVREDFALNHVNFIENWSKVIVHKDGSFEKIDYPLALYSVDLKDSYDILHKLLIKYKKLVDKLIDENNFIPTLTGGMDTRALSALWRDSYKDDIFLMRDVKNDGKNHIDLGQKDLQCALEVGQRLKLSKHKENRDGKKTLSGMFTDNINSLSGIYLNNPNFVYKFIQHSTRWSGQLRPYADDLFLQIKQPKEKLFRCLILLLLCPDLIDIPLIGSQWLYEKYNKQPYNFTMEFAPYINEAKEILSYWGEEKCRNILEYNKEEQ